MTTQTPTTQTPTTQTPATAATTTQARIPPTELTGLFGTVMKFAARRMLGTVPDSMGVLAHHPALMRLDGRRPQDRGAA